MQSRLRDTKNHGLGSTAQHGSSGPMADASVFPTIPRGNVQAPVMALAERAAQLIAADA